MPPADDRRRFDTALAWYFVSVWGAGYLATRVGLQYSGPLTFVTLRFALGVALMAPAVLWLRPSWPATPREFLHVVVAGLLMHAANLGGSTYAQSLGISAGITALLLSTQPLLTAVIAWRWLHERLAPAQWSGVFIGLAGVALVVWHKIDMNALTLGSLAAVTLSLLAVTAGTLYQRVFCANVDLRLAPLMQFGASLVLTAPLAWVGEGLRVTWTWPLAASVAFLVILASIFGMNALHVLMRHGKAAKVTTLIYLTPILAVVLEYLMFAEVPTGLSLMGIAVTCLGVALVAWRRG